MGAMQQSLLWKNPSGAVVLAAYAVLLFQTGGGSVSFSTFSDGTTTGDTSGWFQPTTAGAGTGRWIIITSTAGLLTMSGASLGVRLQLNSTLTWTGTYAGGAVRTRDFTVEVYDAATGGNLLGSGTLHLEIDGA